MVAATKCIPEVCVCIRVLQQATASTAMLVKGNRWRIEECNATAEWCGWRSNNDRAMTGDGGKSSSGWGDACLFVLLGASRVVVLEFELEPYRDPICKQAALFRRHSY